MFDTGTQNYVMVDNCTGSNFEKKLLGEYIYKKAYIAVVITELGLLYQLLKRVSMTKKSQNHRPTNGTVHMRGSRWKFTKVYRVPW